MGRSGADSNGDRGFSEAPLIDMDSLPDYEGWTTTGGRGSWGPPEGWKSGDGAWKYESKVDGNWISTAGDYVYYQGKRSQKNDVYIIPDIGVFGRNKMKDRMSKCGTMGCNNSGGPDEGGWDSGFGANGTQYGEQFTMVDTPTSLNDPQRLANKVPGTGRTVSEHCTSYLDKNGYLTNACNFKKHEDETDPTDADFDRQLPEPAFETKRGHSRILDPVTVTGCTRNHGLQGRWH